MNVRVELPEETKLPVEAQRSRLRWRRTALCKLLSPGGARRFAQFARTKYGKNLDDATIAKAHEEWLDLQTNCEC